MTVEPTMQPEDLAWLASRAGLTVGPQLRGVKAVQDGRIVAMLGFDGWTPAACSVHVAVEHPAALRHVLRLGFSIPFVEMGKHVVIAAVLSTNKRSLNLVRHLGFRESGRIRNGWAVGVNLHLFEMQRSDCRWIPQEA